MTDRNIPVTEDELHAYIDNELPAERRGDVEAWLASHPDDAARVQSWRTMADAAARYYSLSTRRSEAALDERLVHSPQMFYGAIAATLASFLVAGGPAGSRSARGRPPPQNLTVPSIESHRLTWVSGLPSVAGQLAHPSAQC